jgi:hypothetical protein
MTAIAEMGGDKPVRSRNRIRSDESTVTILKGSPVFFTMDGTRDGIDAVSAEGLAAAKQGFFAGLSTIDIAPGKIRETIIFGTVEYARVVTATRAATTDVWASYAAIATGDILSVLTATGSVQALTRAGAGSAGVFPMFAAVGTIASATTQASSVGSATFSGSLYSTSTLKVFVRGH